MQSLLQACALFTDANQITSRILEDGRAAGLSPQDTVIATCGSSAIDEPIINWCQASSVIMQTVKSVIGELTPATSLVEELIPECVSGNENQHKDSALSKQPSQQSYFPPKAQKKGRQ